MIRLLRSLAFSTIALLLLGVPVLAQTPAATPVSTPAPASLAGLETAVSRTYTVDPGAIAMENPESFAVINVHLFRFDTPDHAAAAWDSARSSTTGLMAPGSGEMEIHEEEIDDLGDQAYTAWLSASPEEGITGYYRVLYVQDAEFLYLLTAMAGNEEHTLILNDLAQAIADRDTGSDPTTFNPDGTSTGGIWDKLPATGDNDAQGLTAFSDKDITAPTEE